MMDAFEGFQKGLAAADPRERIASSIRAYAESVPEDGNGQRHWTSLGMADAVLATLREHGEATVREFIEAGAAFARERGGHVERGSQPPAEPSREAVRAAANVFARHESATLLEFGYDAMEDALRAAYAVDNLPRNCGAD